MADDPITAMMRGMAVRAARTASARELLDQALLWRDAAGEVHEVATMDRRHAANCVRLLTRSAQRLLDGEIAAAALAAEPNGTQAAYDFEDYRMWLYGVDAEEWLLAKALVVALRERAGDARPGPSRAWLARHPWIAAKRFGRGLVDVREPA